MADVVNWQTRSPSSCYKNLVDQVDHVGLLKFRSKSNQGVLNWYPKKIVKYNNIYQVDYFLLAMGT